MGAQAASIKLSVQVMVSALLAYQTLLVSQMAANQPKAAYLFTGTAGSMDACKGFGPGAGCCQAFPAGQSALAENSSSRRGQATASPGWLVTSAVASLPSAGICCTMLHNCQPPLQDIILPCGCCQANHNWHSMTVHGTVLAARRHHCQR